ncbi:2423_t:CDS:2 [Ambispora leptoticha]|uniref:2423_t:CDS:1 n=1 Tax=Ambispora leptoticha TaxID=144679 RepID=A0A9N8W057_9GLOM|nr:2423_t:CDS:2 [Ambispora leptoticha]
MDASDLNVGVLVVLARRLRDDATDEKIKNIVLHGIAHGDVNIGSEQHEETFPKVCLYTKSLWLGHKLGIRYGNYEMQIFVTLKAVLCLKNDITNVLGDEEFR